MNHPNTEVCKEIETAANRVGSELLLKLNPESQAYKALVHAIQQTVSVSTSLILMATEENIIEVNFDRITDAIDLAFGDILPFTSEQFETFTKGEPVEQTARLEVEEETIKALYLYRQGVLDHIEKTYKVN